MIWFILKQKWIINVISSYVRTGILPNYVTAHTLNIPNILPDDYIVDLPIPPRIKHAMDMTTMYCYFVTITGLRNVNDRLGDDAGDERFICVSGNGCSVVDYVLCKSDMFVLINSFDVAVPNILSDHCVVSFSLATLTNISEAVRDEDNDSQ